MVARKYPWLAGLTKAQREAATFEGPRLAIIAAPGAGKTRTLAARVVDLVERRGAHPSQIVAFSFTRSAAAELRSRIEILGGDSLALVSVTTFHALALRVLREDPAAVGLPPTFSVARESEAAACFGSMYEGPITRPESKRLSPSKLREIQTRFYATGDFPTDSVAGSLLATFAQRLRDLGLVHAGLLLPMLKAGVGRSERIRLALGGFVHVLIDEAHDASPCELWVAEWIASDRNEGETGPEAAVDPTRPATSTRPPAPRGGITIVADPRQAIFGWRHACGSRVVDDFMGIGATGRIVELAQTFRFGAAIAEHANRAAARSAGWEPGDLAAGLAIEPAADLTDSAVHAVLGASLAFHVAEAVKAYGPAKVAVLCRSRRDAELVALSMNDLCETIHAEDGDPSWFLLAQALARLILNRADNAAFRTLYEAEERRLLDRCSFHSFASRAGRARSLLEEYQRELAHLDAEQGTLLRFVCDTTPATTFDVVAERAVRFDRPHREGAPVELYAPIVDGLGIGGLELREAIDRIATRSESDAFAAVQARGMVSVSTVHAAKGREWDAVFVVTSDRWPWGLPRAKRSAWRDEEWRVYFVAVTRARREAVIVYGTEADLSAVGLEAPAPLPNPEA